MASSLRATFGHDHDTVGGGTPIDDPPPRVGLLGRLSSLMCAGRPGGPSLRAPRALTAAELRERAKNLRALADYTDWLGDEIYSEAKAKDGMGQEAAGLREASGHAAAAQAAKDPLAHLKNARGKGGKGDALTPHSGTLIIEQMRSMRPAGSENAPRSVGEPSRFPDANGLFVGGAADAKDASRLYQLGIRAVCNVAGWSQRELLNVPSFVAPAKVAYDHWGLAYLELNCKIEDPKLIENALGPVSDFIRDQHARGNPVLLHCSAGVNRAPALAVAYLMMRDKAGLFDVLEPCMAARPNIIQNQNIQQQLTSLAFSNDLLYRPKAWDDSMPGLTPGSWNKTFVIPQLGNLGPHGELLGPDGNPLLGPHGELLGPDGKPLLGPNGELLVPDGKPLLGPHGELLGPDGKPLLGPHGELLGPDGKPLLGPNGELLGPDGKPLLGPHGELLGPDGKPLTGPHGELLGPDGKPLRYKNGKLMYFVDVQLTKAEHNPNFDPSRAERERAAKEELTQRERDKLKADAEALAALERKRAQEEEDYKHRYQGATAKQDIDRKFARKLHVADVQYLIPQLPEGEELDHAGDEGHHVSSAPLMASDVKDPYAFSISDEVGPAHPPAAAKARGTREVLLEDAHLVGGMTARVPSEAVAEAKAAVEAVAAAEQKAAAKMGDYHL